ncbi:MAG: tyrosine-type recombinase/integrase [Anaeroplasma sp.]|nr:tyrosine-type recombinase/integrase [Anaeroplasma sp.]
MPRKRKNLCRKNGSGTVVYLGDRRRRPYAVRVTVGWKVGTDGRAIQIKKYIGYYEDYDSAMEALIKYNRDPSDLDMQKVTFKDVYELMYEEFGIEKKNRSSINGYNCGFALLEPLHYKVFSSLTTKDFKRVFDDSDKNYEVIKKAKIVLNQMYSYAYANKLVDRKYSQEIKLSDYNDRKVSEKPHRAFTIDEIKLLINSAETRFEKIAKMQLYSGVRISELLQLKKEDVHLKERYFYISHGKNKYSVRMVPIHQNIINEFQEFMELGNEHLIFDEKTGNPYDVTRYIVLWRRYLKRLGIEYTGSHSCRYTLQTYMAQAGVDQRVIDKITGHSSDSIGVNVYTDYQLDYLIGIMDSFDYI